MKTKPLPARLKTLVESNPIALMFAVDALIKHADLILRDEAATLLAMKDSFVSGPAWIAAAKEFKTILPA
jgi:hypothetical protein